MENKEKINNKKTKEINDLIDERLKKFSLVTDAKIQQIKNSDKK